MALRRTIPEPPPGFNDRRVLARVVYAALGQAGYEVHFLNGGRERQGLYVGISGPSAIAIGSHQLASFTAQDASRCAQALNAVFRRAIPSAAGIAAPRQGVTHIGSVPYAEVVVQCTNNRTLRALYRSLVE